MYLSTVHWKRTVQGFTGYPPPAYNFIRWRLFHFPDEESIAFLEKLGVDAVIIHPKGDIASGNLEDDSRWSAEGPFPEGHITLRLLDSKGVQYELLDDAGPALIEMDPREWRVHGSTPGAARARNRDPHTSWSTAPDIQSEHNFYAIRFPELTVPARVSMGLGAPYEFPMRFQIVGLGENGQWVDIAFDQIAAYDRFFAQLIHRPLEAKLEVDLIDAPAVREIRIRITETDPFEIPWAMTEVHVYKWADGSSPGPSVF